MKPTISLLRDFVSLQQEKNSRVVDLDEAQRLSTQPGVRVLWRPSGEACAIVYGVKNV